MGKMSDLALDIEEALCAGDSFGDIAVRFGVSVNDVMNIHENMMESDFENMDIELEDYDDSMDGDFDSAMSSAGYGTDEDYGYYGDDY